METTLYLADGWLIWAGSIKAYCFYHIKGRGGSSNKVKIKTVEGKQYQIWCLNQASLNKISRFMILVKGENGR